MTRCFSAALCAAVVTSGAFLSPLAWAQETPAIFVTLAGPRTGEKTVLTTAPTKTIPAIGNGWTYSAAAPVDGTIWNVIERPKPIPSNRNSTRGLYVCTTASNIGVTSATGQAEAAHLTISLDIQDLDPGASRTEPNGAGGSKDALAPQGLMDSGWAVYLPGNGSVHTVSGIKPGAHYLVYFYGANNGARFTLDAANVPEGDASFIEISGTAAGNVFATTNGVTAPIPPAAPAEPSPRADLTSWGRLHAVVGSDGVISFRTSRNAISGQTVNGYQLVPFPLPTITAQPRSELRVQNGAEFSLLASAAGEGVLSYQWRKNGVAIQGNPSASTSELKLSAVKATDAGTYDLAVTNPGGTITTNPSVVTILGAPPKPATPTKVELPKPQQTKPESTGPRSHRKTWGQPSTTR